MFRKRKEAIFPKNGKKSKSWLARNRPNERSNGAASSASGQGRNSSAPMKRNTGPRKSKRSPAALGAEVELAER